MKIDIMVDCRVCGSQNWKNINDQGSPFEFSCERCGQKSEVSTEDDLGTYDCHICQSYIWDKIESTDDHHIFKCQNCDLVIEFWLRQI
jgi:transcription elongation factor Elf1